MGEEHFKLNSDPLIIEDLEERKRRRLGYLGSFIMDYDHTTEIMYLTHHSVGTILNKTEVATVIKALQNFVNSDISDRDIEIYNERASADYLRDLEGPAHSITTELSEISIPETYAQEKNRRPGYIYFIKEYMSGTVKIGKTTDLSTRTRLFEVKLPFEWSVIHSIKVSDMDTAESAFHSRYKDKRVNGEWFSLDNTDMEEIVGGNIPDVVVNLLDIGGDAVE